MGSNPIEESYTAEAELDQCSPAKAAAVGSNPARRTFGLSSSGRMLGSEPSGVGSNPTGPTFVNIGVWGNGNSLPC